jgi:Fic family protein
VTDLRERFGGLPPLEQAGAIWSDIWHLEAHHSTALEGNTLVLRQVQVLLDEGKTAGARPLTDYLEVHGYAQAATWVYGHALQPGEWSADGLIALREVRHVHARAMTPVWDAAAHPHASQREAPGMFREHDLHPFAGGLTPPSWPLIDAAMQGWLERVHELTPALTGSQPSDVPMPELLAEVHNRFERVHPFIDGNGRAGRLVMNLMLVRMGYPPAIILTTHREQYLAAMRKADNDDFGPLGEMIARSIYDNINRFILPAIASEDRLVPLTALVTPDSSLPALRQAAQRGRLNATQTSDGRWLSTRHDVETYARNKGKHLRK